MRKNKIKKPISFSARFDRAQMGFDGGVAARAL